LQSMEAILRHNRCRLYMSILSVLLVLFDCETLFPYDPCQAKGVEV